MDRFEYVSPDSLETVIRMLEEDSRSRLLAGGTDLLPEMKLRIVQPRQLIDIKAVPALNGVDFEESQGLRIGALATLSSLASLNTVKERYRVLFEAINLAASPQLRQRGTLGGNLNQDSRCWYYRGPFCCWLKGGETCYAREGQNYHHAVFNGGPCFTVHPSDLPPALAALNAQVLLLGPGGERTLPVEDYYRRPQPDSRRLTVIRPAEIVTGIRIPLPSPDSVGTFLKAMDRRAWAFALVSAAVQLTLDGDVVRNAGIVLGGVAPGPWRLHEVETLLKGQPLNEASIKTAAEASLREAHPLRHNAYKLDLLQGLLTEALTGLIR